jgi:hypothetical protein
MGIAGSMTIWPWTFIFGVVIIILLVYPGFKSAFSDVIGYYYVSNLANSVLTELLVDRKLQNEIDKTPMTPNKRRAMEDAADAILKICSNTAVIINQMVPSNFNAYWNILKPLMKAKYQDDSSEATQEIKSRLFEIVITRDNVGEAMWFMYTGFVITSIVQMRIAAQGCALTPATMEKNYQQFLEQEQQAKQQKELATSQVYTIT